VEKAVAYVRVSRKDEEPSNQLFAIKAYAEKSGLEIEKEFIEYESGAVPPRERPRYSEMLAYARARGIQHIIFYDISRLGRTLEDTLLELRSLLEEGFRVHFVREQFLNDISNPSFRKLMASILAWFAELYRVDVAERTKAALERAKAQGKHVGRKPAKIPWNLVKRLREKGLTKKQIYYFLVGAGYLRYTEKGVEKVLSYDRFLRRWKREFESPRGRQVTPK